MRVQQKTAARIVRGPFGLVLGLFFAGLGPAAAADVSVVLENHRFAPATIVVSPNSMTTISLTNKDDQAEEFDSTSLKVEKVVAPHSTGLIRLRPLAPGRYPFMGEFHSDTAQGLVIVK